MRKAEWMDLSSISGAVEKVIAKYDKMYGNRGVVCVSREVLDNNSWFEGDLRLHMSVEGSDYDPYMDVERFYGYSHWFGYRVPEGCVMPSYFAEYYHHSGTNKFVRFV